MKAETTLKHVFIMSVTTTLPVLGISTPEVAVETHKVSQEEKWVESLLFKLTAPVPRTR